MSDVDKLVSELQELVKQEPWRKGQGQPINALDPSWSIERSVLCDGEIEYEAGTKWWFCKKCGYCGNHGYGQVHRPIEEPAVYLLSSVNDYLRRKEREGLSTKLALNQLLHVVGVAIRYAAAQGPNDLGGYVQKLIVP